jgi:Cu-processing system ATP-binding protein
MINVSGLKKKFGKLTVLSGITVEFRPGKVTAVIGHNGSGKTTLIKCILGMVLPDAGEIRMNDHDISGKWEYRKDIGYMPQIGRYPDNMKIGQVISMMKDIRSDYPYTLDEELINKYGLELLAGKIMRTLSGGTRQKVSAALAFLFSPQIMILDEPTAGLDPAASEVLKEKILKEKQSGKLIIITSHIMSEVEELADDILYMFEGRVLFHKSISELKTETGEMKIGRAISKLIPQ